MLSHNTQSAAGRIPVEFAIDYSVEIIDLAGRAAGIVNQALDPDYLAGLLGISLLEACKLWDGIAPPPVWLCGAVLIALHRKTLQGAAHVAPFMAEEIYYAHYRLARAPAA
jgi:hypothetical protein